MVEGQQLDIVLSVGQLLKAAREKLQMSCEDIADHLRLKPEMIVRIERDQFSPEEYTVFVKGYIRSYAKTVNVDLAEVENYFLNLGVMKPVTQVKPIDFEVNEVKLQKSGSSKWLSISVIGLFALLALIWVFWQHNNNDQDTSTLTETTTVPATVVSPSSPATLPAQENAATNAVQNGNPAKPASVMPTTPAASVSTVSQST